MLFWVRLLAEMRIGLSMFQFWPSVVLNLVIVLKLSYIVNRTENCGIGKNILE